MTHPLPDATIAALYEREWARVLGTITHLTRDLELAEDATQDAFIAAIDSWPQSGIPTQPVAWLIATAKRKAIDRLRRQTTLQRKLPLLIVPDTTHDDDPTDGDDVIPDETLRLIFTCCHPALAPDARVALTLRLITGIPTADIATLFLVSEPTMAARLTRAKRKIQIAGIPYRVPPKAEMPARLPAVLQVIFLLFTNGHGARRGPEFVRPTHIHHAERLARMLVALLPDDAEATALLALIVLAEARRPARHDADGELILLPDQDRRRWNHALIAEGLARTRRALVLSAGDPGPYALEAAIAALHTEASSYDATDWEQVVSLYNMMMDRAPSPLIALSRAVALGERDGPAVMLTEVDRLADDPALHAYAALHIARGDALAGLGRVTEASVAFEAALATSQNAQEIRSIQRRLARLPRSS